MELQGRNLWAEVMKCFPFSFGEKSNEPKTTKSISVRSTSTSMSADHEMRTRWSEFNSQNVSELSTESSGLNSSTILPQQQGNLREFSFLELKSATKNFSRSLMVGEGGFGGVYRGVIRSLEDPLKKIDIAVKQLSRRGLQARMLLQILFFLLDCKIDYVGWVNRQSDFRNSRCLGLGKWPSIRSLGSVILPL